MRLKSAYRIDKSGFLSYNPASTEHLCARREFTNKLNYDYMTCEHGPQGFELAKTSPTDTQPASKPKEGLLPPTKVTVLLSPQSEARHAVGLSEHLRPGVIVVPEMPGRTDETQTHLQTMSTGTARSLQVLALESDADDRMRGLKQQILTKPHNSEAKVILVGTREEDAVNELQQGVDFQSGLLASKGIELPQPPAIDADAAMYQDWG